MKPSFYETKTRRPSESRVSAKLKRGIRLKTEFLRNQNKAAI